MNTNLIRSIIIIVLALNACFPAFSQDKKVDRNSVGLGGGASKTINDAGLAPVSHLHYSRSFSSQSPFSVIIGMEVVMDADHRHTTLGIGIEYNIWKDLNVSAAPGISFLPDEGPEAGLHFELAYDFQLGKVGLGPMLEYGMSTDDRHLVLGVHTGIGF